MNADIRKIVQYQLCEKRRFELEGDFMKRILAIGILRRQLPEYLRATGIIKQAHVNGGKYFGDNLIEGRWAFPESTMVQRTAEDGKGKEFGGQ